MIAAPGTGRRKETAMCNYRIVLRVSKQTDMFDTGMWSMGLTWIKSTVLGPEHARAVHHLIDTLKHRERTLTLSNKDGYLFELPLAVGGDIADIMAGSGIDWPGGRDEMPNITDATAMLSIGRA